MTRFPSFHILFLMFITGNNNNNKHILFMFMFHLCLILVCVLNDAGSVAVSATVFTLKNSCP